MERQAHDYHHKSDHGEATREEARIYDRVPERRTPVKIDRERIRRIKASENRKLARERLL